MRAALLLSALALAATAAAFAPSAAAMQLPPPCETASMTTCCPLDPSFAPCCTLLSCPPTIARCPDLDVDTSSVGPFRAPWVDAETDSDCSANACINTSDCSDAACQAGDHFCCSLQGTLSFCTSLQSASSCALLAGGAVQTALPVPQPCVTLNDDGTVTVSETIASCPNGFWKDTIHYTASPVYFVLDECVPMCACMPLEAAPAAPEGSA